MLLCKRWCAGAVLKRLSITMMRKARQQLDVSLRLFGAGCRIVLVSLSLSFSLPVTSTSYSSNFHIGLENLQLSPACDKDSV